MPTLSYQPAAKARRVRPILLAVSVTILILTLLLWFLHLDPFYRKVDTPGASAAIPGFALTATTPESGLHLKVERYPGFHFDAAVISRQDHTSYRAELHRYGFSGNLLGLAVAADPGPVRGGCVFIEPYAATIVPYWMLFLGSAWLSLRFAGLWARVAPHCRWSRFSATGTGLFAMAFIALNFIPLHMLSAHGPEAPENVWDWMSLIFSPPGYCPEIMLRYGFPFVVFEQGFIGGHPVDIYHGKESGWVPHRAGENLAILLIGTWAVRLTLQFIRTRFGRAKVSDRPASVPLTGSAHAIA